MLSLTGWLRPVQSQIEFLFLSIAQMSPSRKTALTHTDQQTADTAFIEVLTLNQVNLISRAFCITWLQVFGNVVFSLFVGVSVCITFVMIVVWGGLFGTGRGEEVMLTVTWTEAWWLCFFNREWCTQVTLVKVSYKNMEVEMSITDALWWIQQQI